MRVWKIISNPGPDTSYEWIKGLTEGKAVSEYIKFTLENGFVALGFGWIPDFRKIDKETLEKKLKEKKPKKWKKYRDAIHDFRDNVTPGDCILMYSKGYAFAGIVNFTDTEKPYYYVDRNSSQNIKNFVGYNNFPHRIRVSWISKESYFVPELKGHISDPIFWEIETKRLSDDLMKIIRMKSVELKQDNVKKGVGQVETKSKEIQTDNDLLWQAAKKLVGRTLQTVRQKRFNIVRVSGSAIHLTIGKDQREISYSREMVTKFCRHRESGGEITSESLKKAKVHFAKKSGYSYLPVIVDEILSIGSIEVSRTFYEQIVRLRKSNLIPKDWKIEDIRPFLKDLFGKNTINSCPHNCCISFDGKSKGNFVKHGAEPKFYRVKEGTFILIDDPENEEDDEAQDLKYQHEIEKARPTELSKGPQKVPQRTDSKNGERWKTNPSTAKAVLEDCKYLCDFDNNHKTFTSKITGQNYVEAHHLIPMNLQGMFSYSLDIPANIVSLCPSCHRQFHHAALSERNQIIELFYNRRKKQLAEAKITIDLNILLKKYR